ncbi:RNA polymerase sigma factor [Undibacterium baiyunense]|uniref:RNA polymerase sigma factor n=1 Tax=Undibacterium baiyunense TaxID=2828731 RepID=A0A941I1Z2_9BURK|nr:RNA polymerase sigma factor [Undibacterium baiyunense]MBR7746918.1 RNA polymerase sigma factor [Undibacterium baiyunense]
MSDLLPDIELVRRMRNGDQAAFVALYRRHQAALYRYAVLRCGSAQVAADVVQEVFVGLMSNQYHYDGLKGHLLYFLFGVARNLAMKFDEVTQHRFQNLESVSTLSDSESDDMDESMEVMSEEANPLERLLQYQMAEDLRVAINDLLPHYRDVLILYEMQEMSYLDIANICQINVGTVRSRLSRARQALAERLQAYRREAA